MRFLVNNKTKAIDEILFTFYNNDNNLYVKKLITKDFLVTDETNFDETLSFFKKSGIKYSIEKTTSVTYIEPEGYYIACIIYKNDDLNRIYHLFINMTLPDGVAE